MLIVRIEHRRFLCLLSCEYVLAQLLSILGCGINTGQFRKILQTGRVQLVAERDAQVNLHGTVDTASDPDAGVWRTKRTQEISEREVALVRYPQTLVKLGQIIHKLRNHRRSDLLGAAGLLVIPTTSLEILLLVSWISSRTSEATSLPDIPFIEALEVFGHLRFWIHVRAEGTTKDVEEICS